MFKNILMFCPC